MLSDLVLWGVIIIVLFLIAMGLKVVRPVEAAAVERFGRYHGIKNQGLTWIIPFIDRMIKVNTTEMLVDCERQEIITKDNLNCFVSAQVYFRVKKDEVGIKSALYNVFNYEEQIVALAKTTLRNVIGNLTLKEANSERARLNTELQATLSKETKNWGIEVVRTELKEIEPPKDVQETMNKIVKAANEKQAAVDFATAKETQADGEKRASIKSAEGIRQAKILQAQGEAESIKLVNEAANKYFRGNAKDLKKIESAQDALKNGTKFIIPKGSSFTTVFAEGAGVTPIPVEKEKK
jgi:regulator of protease activity HflC (stomatin/prohibitin superfamily)